MSPRTASADYYRGIRAAVTWLHEEATRMNDPHARAVLNSAAFHLGVRKPEFVAPAAEGFTLSQGEAPTGARLAGLALDEHLPSPSDTSMKGGEGSAVADSASRALRACPDETPRKSEGAK